MNVKLYKEKQAISSLFSAHKVWVHVYCYLYGITSGRLAFLWEKIVRVV